MTEPQASEPSARPADEARPRPGPGAGIVTSSFVGTGAFALVAGAGVLAPGLEVVTAVVSGVLFAVGCAVFLCAYALAVSRSRTEAIGIGGLYFLTGDSAPASVRRRLMVALVAQVVLALVAASLRPYTPMAFGILVPVFGLGLTGLWGARHGRFAARTTQD